MEKEHKQSVYFSNDEDKRRGVDYVMKKIFGFYKEYLELGPEYKTNNEGSSSVSGEGVTRRYGRTSSAAGSDTRPPFDGGVTSTDGVGDAIVVPPILANQFELKIDLLNLVTAIDFHGFKNDDPHSHIRRFTKITQTVKLNNVSSDVVKLLLFPFSLEGAAQTWLEKEPPNSITTWNDLVSKFVNHFFPPSKTTNLRNEITIFQQRFSETFAEAWDRFKDLLNKCPHHGFSPLHQIDTFYNSLNQYEQVSLNSAANGNFLTKNTQEALTIIENKSKVQTSRNKPQSASASGSSTQDAHITSLTKQVEALLSLHRPVNSVQNGCEMCGGPLACYKCQAAGGYTQEDVYATTGTYNQGGNSYQPQGNHNLLSYRSNNYLGPPGFNNQNQNNQGYNQGNNQDKEKLEELANTPINVECSAILLNKILEKLKDPRKFLIPCILQDLEVYNSLANSGASINLMPLSIYEKLGVGPLKTHSNDS
ncbi:reverse transcriptase domain-containing protein [Tanacetum coccineum]|uniref:Reverse transcriptase domain-containing protein n=1 Tax=Tanacetum coccineum TaxID=301880 RepID=A0ABQ5EV12_9ASTR